MKNIPEILRATNKALARKKIGPVRLAQMVHMPLGPLCLFTVGDLKKGALPTAKDLALVSKTLLPTEFKLNKKSKTKTWWGAQFWPPFIKVKELFFERGTAYFVFIGDLEKHILPTVKDLKQARDRFCPALKHLGISKASTCIFFPPILTAKRTVKGKRECLDIVLGDKEYGIFPNKNDLKLCKDLVVKAVKDLGLKATDVKVKGI